MRKHYTFLILIFSVFIGKAQNPDDIVYIPDANFKARLLNPNNSSSGITASNYNFTYNNTPYADIDYTYCDVDINGDGEIQYSEAQLITFLNLDNRNISSLEGIEAFTNLKSLSCNENLLTNLNVTSLSNLIYLNCGGNQFTHLDVSNLTNLKYFGCSNTSLTSISPLDGLNIHILDLEYNQLSYISLTNMPFLEYIYLGNNQITDIQISNVPNAYTLQMEYNQLTAVDLSNASPLEGFAGSFNELTSIIFNNDIRDFSLNSNPLVELDLTGLGYLYDVNLRNCSELKALFLKGTTIDYIDIENCLNLRYICVDENSFSENLEYYVLDYLGYNCNFNTYCSFVPGETYYTVEGTNKLDVNANGCDSNDNSIPHLKFNITDGITTSTIISNNEGNYFIPVFNGTHTITPIVENSSYYIISPPSIAVTFPATTSPFTQDFCITPVGVHQDLEITIVPITPVRPGFDATFKIIYKNNGTQSQSGSIQFNFDDALMDFVSSNPNTYNQTLNNIYINYSNLLPTETREMTVVMNINSPMETPAVNGGDELGFYAIISPFDEDENYDDNHSQIKVVVVNSYDPNDKTCLEGATITPSMVGQYVHYVIRFENTGTFAAENIVVKDMIDTTKFDVSTLIPQYSSHDFFTRINGDKVEFFFENINLPFDDANNDGYVAFKIKTKPTLVLGDTFTNSASIYFDYNFPIVTDPAVTTVALLNTNDFDFGTYFTLYPNPAKDVLNFEVKNEIGVKSVSVYNTLGQIVMAITNVDNLKSIDVSSLTAGSYFVKVYTDKGSSSSKFIKQ